jgi:hypothetical protein
VKKIVKRLKKIMDQIDMIGAKEETLREELAATIDELEDALDE